MIIVIVLLLLVILLVRSGAGERFYYVVLNKNVDSLVDTNFVTEIYRLGLLRKSAALKVDIDKIESKTYKASIQSFENNLANYYFENRGLPNLLKETDALKHLREKIGSDNLVALQNFYKTLCVKYPDGSVAIVADVKKDNILLDKFKMHHFRNRAMYTSKLAERLKVVYFYKMIESLQPGNQWTLSSNKKITELKNTGFLIECFGSSLNARLRYFCSLNKIDEPFGRLGDGYEVMDKIANGEELKWNNEIVNNGVDGIKLLINPPSTNLLVYESLNKVIKILERRNKVEIIYEIPKSKRNSEFDVLVQKYNAKETILKKAWTYEGVEKSLIGREWVEFHIIKK